MALREEEHQGRPSSTPSSERTDPRICARGAGRRGLARRGPALDEAGAIAEWAFIATDITETIARDIETGRATRRMGTSTDITDRKAVERALQESELYSRGIFENAAVGMIVSDAFGLRVIVVDDNLTNGHILDE